MPWKDQEKARASRRKHYHANKEQYYQRNLKQKARNRDFIIFYLKTHPCADCGESDIRCLQFDHNSREDKSFNIGMAVVNGLGLEAIQAEIEKCTVRCANCHAKRTSLQFGWYKELVVNALVTQGTE